jgi:thiamine pyrophosphate-dependent acetolactate synthase large subunit-like protein
VLGKQAIIDFLVRHTIRDIFYLPGIHTLSLNEGLSAKNINVFIPRHEANMAFMADGFARVSGKIGVLIVTPGPGLGNVVTGCMEAYGDDIPLLVIHIDTGREEIGRGILHELVEPENMFRYVTKKTFSVHGREDLVAKLDMAYNLALMERRGPVLISIPYTLLEKEVSSQGYSESNPIPAHQFNCLAGIEKVLAQKKRPVIIGGKSLMFEQARPLLDEICMSSSIPFLTTTSGKGTLNEENPWCFGNIMQKGIAKEIVSSADITIAIGTRLRDVDARRRGVKIRDLVHVDIDDAWFNKNYPASYTVSGEILPFLHDLKNAVQSKTFDWPLMKLKEAQHRERKELQNKFLGFQLMGLVKDSIPDDTTTVWDLNLMAYWAEYYYPVRHQHTFIMPRGISSIFYALPAAIGAKLGRPEQPCLTICGDGGILPTIGELSTIRKYNIPVVILIFNNNSFGILEDYMRATHSLEGIMSLENPDFVRLASSFGIKGKRTNTLRQLKKIFSDSVRWDEPFLVEFFGPVFAPPWRT